MKIPAFITVRTSSTRLPHKCLLPFGDCNVLEHITRRSKYYDFEPIVCTTIEPADDIIEKIAVKEKVKFFRGSVNNKLKRWMSCCDTFAIKKFHTVDADDPFFDGELVRESFAVLEKGYDVVYPTPFSSEGAASVGFSLTRGIIAKACESTVDNTDTEMMWHYLQQVSGIRIAKLEDKPDAVRIRLTLDYEEDYWLLCSVRRIAGNLAARKEVDDLFRRNPDLYKINWFRQAEWKEKQLAAKMAGGR